MRVRSTSFYLSILILLSSISVAGCNTTNSEDEQQQDLPPQSVLGDPWFVEYISDRPVIDRSPASIRFDADGQVSGNTSCNRFFGA